MASQIKTTIKCTNIAPLDSIDKTFESPALKLGIFASNGSGKTYLSRMFRLIENTQPIEEDESGSLLTDQYLSFDKNQGNFEFKVVSSEGVTVENAGVSIQKGKKPVINSSFYIFHTFNQDYVEENIRTLNYEKDDTIEGYILGKTNIDLSEDEDRLSKIEEEGKQIKEQLKSEIESSLDIIRDVRDIKRLNEFKKITLDNIVALDTSINVSKTVSEYLDDYNKIKSIPENLPKIEHIGNLTQDLSFIEKLIPELEKEYTLSSFADEFKSFVKQEHAFIEQGLSIHSKNTQKCPFCNRDLDESSAELIDRYTSYLNDSEAQITKMFQQYGQRILQIKNDIKEKASGTAKATVKFDEYKSKYISSCEGTILSQIDCTPINRLFESIEESIELKIEHINKKVSFPTSVITDVKAKYKSMIETIENDNKEIDVLNKKLDKANDESREIKRNICLATLYELSIKNKDVISKLNNLRIQYKHLKTDIEKKKETEKINRKARVAETIKKVLGYFFAGKYSLDEETFRLTFNTRSLEKGRVKSVLSEGEKNIIAFAYYLGDTHVRVEREDEYNKLFFVIDDPISSMDYTHVYTLSGVIRDLKKVIGENIGHVKMLVLTHNADFMRILTSNKILDKVLLLRNSKLSEYNDNYTVPYINHLLDIYKIARKGEKASHTTANSIRHIIETLDKFESIKTNENSVKLYIEAHIPQDKKSYTYINDMSHGGWRSEQEPMDEQDYVEVCETLISHIQTKYPKQIEYCESICNKP